MGCEGFCCSSLCRTLNSFLLLLPLTPFGAFRLAWVDRLPGSASGLIALDCLGGIAVVLDLDHAARPTASDLPDDPVEKRARRDTETAGQLDQGVDPRKPLAPLDPGHLGPMDPGVVGQGLLAHVEPAAGPPDPWADDRRDLSRRGIHQPSRKPRA